MNITRKLSMMLCIILCFSAVACCALAETWTETTYERNDSKTHKVITQKYKGTQGKSSSPVGSADVELKEHDFNSNGTCKVCGYTKTKPAPVDPGEEIKPGDNTGIEETEDPTEEKPGEEKPGEDKPSEEQPGEEKPGEEKPGEEQPGEEQPTDVDPGAEEPGTEEPGTEETETKSKTTAAVAAAVTAALTEVADNVEVFGLKVADNVKLLDGMATTGSFLETAAATIQVPSVEEILTSGQKAKFDALSSSEKLMVAMAVLGFADDVKTNSTLSAEAVALIEEILSSLSPAELKAVAASAMTTVTINGVDYEAFVLEYIATENGTSTTVRQTYRYENNEWILTKIEKG